MLLEVRGITKKFGGLTAVQSVEYVQEPRTIYAIIGPNGAGKTTFFNILTGIYKPDSGSVTFDGKSTIGLRPDQVNAVGISRTFQNIRLFNNMNVLENIMVGMHSRVRVDLAEAILRIPRFNKQEIMIRDKSLEIMEFVGLKGKADEIARNLPYGDQRRLEIGRGRWQAAPS
jgi:branched-chain amino acid transport system ATP-binding protein